MNKFKCVLLGLMLIGSGFIFNMEQVSKKMKTLSINEEELKRLGFELFQAAKNGDIVKVKELIKNYANLYGEDSVKFYVNFKNCGIYSILGAASVNNCKDIADFLIKNGADVNYKDNRDQTPLINAFIFSSKDIPALLIDNGANVNDKDCGDYTALHWALKGGCEEKLVKLLIDNGININAKNNDGFIALTFAKQKGRKDIVKIIEDFEKNNKSLFPKLVNAIENNKFEDVKKLLKMPIYMIDIDTGDNALHIASKLLSNEMFLYILGIRPGLINKKNYDGKIPMDLYPEMFVYLAINSLDNKVKNNN